MYELKLSFPFLCIYNSIFTDLEHVRFFQEHCTPLLVLSHLSLGAPTPEANKNSTTTTTSTPDVKQGWTYFCKDAHCKEGCTRGFAYDEPGCIDMHGKKSIKFRTNIGLGEHALVVTSGKGCYCQKNCLETLTRNVSVWRSIRARRTGLYRGVAQR